MPYEILGSGDYRSALAHFNKDTLCYSEGHKSLLEDLKSRVKYCRLGYVPGVIMHYYHGAKANRGYNTRYKQLVKHKFDPNTMLDKDEQGLLIPNENFPKELLKYIKDYFRSRLEDGE